MLIIPGVNTLAQLIDIGLSNDDWTLFFIILFAILVGIALYNL